MLPTATPAALAGVHTRRLDPGRRRVDDLDDATAHVIGPVGGHLDAHPFAGERAVDQHDPPVGGAASASPPATIRVVVSSTSLVERRNLRDSTSCERYGCTSSASRTR